jgi:type II secretory pathway component PulF
MIFLIKKIDKNGKTQIYLDSFRNIADAIEFIEAEGALPVTVQPVPKFISLFLAPFFKPKIKKEEIIEILDNFHLIIKSGIPIQSAIDDFIKESKNPYIKKMLRDISLSLQKGASLSNAVEKYKKFFSNIIVSLIKIGEKTGNLEITLKKGSEFLKKIEDIRKKVKQAMIYPSFAFTAIIVAMLVWLLYVLPKIVNLFKEMDVELPDITVFVMNFSNFLQKYFFYLGFITVSIVLLLVFSLRYKKIKYFFDKMLLHIPIISKFIVYFNTAFFTEYMKLTISSGLPLLDGLNTLKENTNNEVYKQAIEEIIKDIESGKRISDAIKDVNLYPLFAVRMISMGEDSGELENQLTIISDFYYSKIDYLAQNLSKMIEPIMIFILGAFMAIIMLALFGPIYTLIGNIK